MYAGCPITWSSKLQTEIALSTTEAEYIALSRAMREALPFMNLMQEIGAVFEFHNPKPKFHCKVFEDNSGAIEIAKQDKYQPRTKHINIRYHHFRQLVQEGRIVIQPIKSEDNPADILTHPVSIERLSKHLTTLMKWHLLPQVSEGVLQYLKSTT